jgi:hypothetical protein
MDNYKIVEVEINVCGVMNTALGTVFVCLMHYVFNISFTTCGSLYDTYILLLVYSKLSFHYYLDIIFFSQVIRLVGLLTLPFFHVHVTAQRNKYLCNKTNWMH